jgi:hypothetical protein
LLHPQGTFEREVFVTTLGSVRAIGYAKRSDGKGPGIGYQEGREVENDTTLFAFSLAERQVIGDLTPLTESPEQQGSCIAPSVGIAFAGYPADYSF